MPNWPLCFVHASDLHLDQVPSGLSDVPDHLVELLVECPYLAAERVFDAALSHRADFVVLAGDVLDPHAAGPRGVLFLIEQFQKLKQRGIAVYWCGGHADRIDSGVDGIDWPDNVHIFPTDRAVAFTCTHNDRQLARVIGRSNDRRARLIGDDYPSDRQGLFTVAVAYVGENEIPQAHADVDYWAFGGRHTSEPVKTPRGQGHYPGSPQGRSPQDTGGRSCTVVQVEIDGQVRLLPQSTDVVRWLDQHVELPDSAGIDRLEVLLNERLRDLRTENPGVALMVRWYVSGNPRVLALLRHGKQGTDLLDRLRKQHGHDSPPVWCSSFESVGRAELPSAWYDQDGMLGDFLREVRRLEQDDNAHVDLSSFMEEGADAALADLVQLSDAGLRQRVLSRAAALGVDLLTSEGSPS